MAIFFTKKTLYVLKSCLLGFKKGKISEKEGEEEDGNYVGLKKMKTQMNKKKNTKIKKIKCVKIHKGK